MSEAVSIPFADQAAESRERLLVAACGLANDLAVILESCEADHFLRAAAFCRHAVDEVMSRTAHSRQSSLLPSPLDRIIAGVGFDATELELFLLAGLAEEHDGFAGAFALLHPLGEPWPTPGLLAQMRRPGATTDADLTRSLASGPLVRSGLVELPGSAPILRRSLQLTPGIWFAAQGLRCWPRGVREFERSAAVAGLEEWLESPDVRLARRAIQSNAISTVVVQSASEDVAVNRALALFEGLWCAPPAVIECDDHGRRVPELGAFVLAHDVIPVIRVPGRDDGAARRPALLVDHPGVTIVCTRPGDVDLPEDRRVLTVSTAPMAGRARVRMWSSTLPRLRDAAATLAGHHALEPDQARRVAGDVELRCELGGREAEVSDVVSSVRGRIGVALPAGVEIRPPRVRLADVVASPRIAEQLREIVFRVRNPHLRHDFGTGERPGGAGARLLLAGPPGTGKTFTAEALAGELETDLLQIDIARVVSKWIGETEKNLAEAFDAAERAKAVLFFDEADALLGERTGVSDANDRYANLETAYLLTRIERCEGLVVLATNLIRNIDDAFLRRMEFVVHLDEPDIDLRRRLWERELGLGPAASPTSTHGCDATVDVDLLAGRFDIPGGLIRNAAEASMFLAAQDARAINAADVELCVAREYAKVGRSFPAAPPARRSPWETT